MIGRWLRDRRRRETELAEEIATHFRLAVEDRMARGESREEAEAAARREFGSEALVREVTRSQWRGARLESVLREFALALRALRRNPRFTVAAVLCAAIGLGVTMTVLSALHAVLLRPLPYANAGELVWLRAQHQTRATAGEATISPDVLALWRGSDVLAELGTWRTGTTELTGGEQLPERVASAHVTANLFPLLGTAPLHGRWFDATDEASGASDVVLLGHELWRSRFGADVTLVGTTLELEGRPYRVVGVMPPEFSFPEGTQLWRPLEPPRLPPDILFYYGAIGRLAPGRSVAEAREHVLALMRGLQAEGGYANWDFTVASLHDELVAPLRRPILIFQGAALLVLLLACANVGALLLARAAARRQELAVRAALGAGRARLVQHVMLECVALALLGGALGTALSWAGVRLLALAFPDGVPSWIDLSIDGSVLLMAVGLTLLTALLCGLGPAVRAGRSRPEAALAGTARGSGGPHARGRGTLVTVQLAVSLVLLASAALLVRSNEALERSLGFEPAGILTVGIELPRQRYTDDETREAFSAQVREALAGLHGVHTVSATITAAPLQEGPSGGLWDFRVVGGNTASPAGEREQRVARYLVAAGYLTVLGVPILQGRDIDADDEALSTAVVNETFARRYFPAGDAIGRTIEINYAEGRWGGAARIVGVVRDFRHAPPPAELQPAMYTAVWPGAPRQTYVLKTTLANPAVLAPAVRQLVHDIDPHLALRINAQSGVVARTFWRERLQRNVIAIFAALATALALFGVYGVLSYAVAQRTAELGVRLALGASARRLLLHVLAHAARMAAVGIAVGLLAALALTRLLRGLLYEVEPADPLLLAASAAALFVVALGAALVPAWRASRLDPQVAIRGG